MVTANLIYAIIIVPISILIPITVTIINRKFFDESLKIIFYYLLVDGIINIFAAVLAAFGIHNLPVLHVFTVLELLLLSYFYLLVLKNKTIRTAIKYLMILFPILCIINFSFFQSINHFNTNTRPIEALILMGCSLAYFAQTNDANIKWSLNPLNWINTGILLYFSGALFIFSFSNISEGELSKKYQAIYTLMWNIHATLVLAMYLLFAVGFSKCRKQ